MITTPFWVYVFSHHKPLHQLTDFRETLNEHLRTSFRHATISDDNMAHTRNVRREQHYCYLHLVTDRTHVIDVGKL